MTEGGFNSISSEEGRKMIEYILRMEKRMDNLLSIVPSEEELEDDPFGIDDAFEAWGETFFQEFPSLAKLLISQEEDALETVKKSYDKILEVEKICREKVVLYLEFAIEELIEKGIVNLELKKEYRNLQEKFHEIEEKHGEEISEEYISDLDYSVREYFKCYDQFKTLSDVTDKESRKSRNTEILLIIITAIITFIVTILTTLILGILNP